MIQRLSSKLRTNLFAPPSLPDGLLALILLLIVTQASILLMNQPAAYWLDPQYASTNLPLTFLLKHGPLVFTAGALIYLAIASLLLKTLKRAAAFFLASWLFLFHLQMLYWTSNCGFYPIYEIPTQTACNAFRDSQVLVFAFLFFFILFMHLPERVASWGKRIALICSIAWLLLLGYGVFRAIMPPQSAWKPIAPQYSPGPRTLGMIAYDTKRQRAILFGGISSWKGTQSVYDTSTWEWDGHGWQEMKTDVVPPGRIEAGMVYDEARGTVILFGGKNTNGPLGDLWEWNGLTWRQLCPACNPAARYSNGMFFNPDLEKVISYGGYDGKKALPEAWTWNGTTWCGFQFSTSAPALLNSPIIYDKARHRVISFMKDTWGGTWVWEGTAWSHLALAVQPPFRSEATMVYDSETTNSILFGGNTAQDVWLNDTWIFDGQSWSQLNTPFAPPQRYGSMAFYDEIRQSMIIYGGDKIDEIYGDMWELVPPGGK